VDKRIEIIRDFHADHAVIMGDSGQLHNALLNLAVNACDAMPSGGKLILSTAEHAITDNHEAVIEKKLRPGHYVSLTVTDTGCGMDEIIRKRIFEPFFTTKSPGKGTGLGLAGVYRTVINHSGSIDVISMPGRGTVFTISLPAALDNTCHDTTKNRTVWKGSGRVLLVDDEAFVRDVTTRQLTRLGYTVTTCEDGVQALKYYAQHREEVDVVIMDLVMPMLNGVECIAKMKKLNPDVKIIDCTGTNPGIDTSLLMTNKVEEIIRKPFSLSELSQCVLRVCSLPDMPSPFPEQMGG